MEPIQTTTDTSFATAATIPTDLPKTPGSGDDRESFSAAVSAITAALGDQTRREIYLYISDKGTKTAAEVAEVFRLHPNVARHHLEKLLAGGYLEVSLSPHTPGAGRPAKLYQKSRLMKQSDLLPKTDALLITLLKKMMETIPPETLDVIAYQVGWEYGKSLTLNMSVGESMKSLRSAMVTIANSLTALGFSAHTRQEPGGTEIIRDICPFGSLAAGTPALCSVDKAIVEGMLAGLCGPGGQTIVMSSKARGDLSCSTLACETAY